MPDETAGGNGGRAHNCRLPGFAVRFTVSPSSLGWSTATGGCGTRSRRSAPRCRDPESKIYAPRLSRWTFVWWTASLDARSRSAGGGRWIVASLLSIAPAEKTKRTANQTFPGPCQAGVFRAWDARSVWNHSRNGTGAAVDTRAALSFRGRWRGTRTIAEESRKRFADALSAIFSKLLPQFVTDNRTCCSGLRL